MLTKVRDLDPDLHAQMSGVESAAAGDERQRKLGDGTFIKAIEAFIAAHPELTQALMTWLLGMLKTPTTA